MQLKNKEKFLLGSRNSSEYSKNITNVKVTNIKNTITTNDVDKIFANSKNKLDFLKRKNINLPQTTNKSKINNDIIKSWLYSKDIKLVREMFFDININKYKTVKEYVKLINEIQNDWKSKYESSLSWPTTQGELERYLQSENVKLSKNYSLDFLLEIEEKIQLDSKKYFRIKLMNTLINDLIELLIITNNINVLPTLKHNAGLDYYVDGISVDQKVSSSPTKEFTNFCQFNNIKVKKTAIKNPGLVSEFLYTLQGEERFGSEPRVYIIFINETNNKWDTKEIIKKLSIPIKNLMINLAFTYNHKKGSKDGKGIKTYKTKVLELII